MVWKHNFQNCDVRSSSPLRARKRLKSGRALKRACARYPKVPSREAFRIVAATVALVLGLLSALPVHAATESRVVFHNWGRDEVSNWVLVDDYDGSVRIDSSNPGIGQEFTTGPGDFDPYVDAYLLTRLSLSVRNFSGNVTGIQLGGAIHIVNDDGTRGGIVRYMQHSGVLTVNDAFIFTPYDDRPILLQTHQRYMFVLECLNCVEGDERWVAFDTTRDDMDNDHRPSTNYAALGDCTKNGYGAVCDLFPPNHTGWEIGDYHVRSDEGWVHTNDNEHILITRGDAIWLYYPETPINLTELPSGKPGEVNLAWDSPERPEYEIPEAFDPGICCYGPVPPPPGIDPEITHHEYRYKLTDDQAWGEWTEIPHSAPGDHHANQTTIPGLRNGVPYDFQVRAVNEDGPSPPDSAVGMAGGELGICPRSPAVRDAIVDKISAVDDCAEVTADMLAGRGNIVDGELVGIELGGPASRLVIRASDYEYKYGDFFGLMGLTALELTGSPLSVITWEMFRDLTSLTTLNLSDNEICKIDAGALNHPVALEILFLNDNHLGDISACPGVDEPSMQGHVFNYLTSLQVLNLNNNRLSEQSFDYLDKTYAELPTFQKLTALREIRLRGNGLEDHHLQRSYDTGGNSVSIFTAHNPGGNEPSGLPDLQLIDLSNNRLTTLPDKIFFGLSNLSALHLDRNAADPMIMTVSLATDEQSRVKAMMPTGAPFTVILPVNVADGSIADGANALAIPTGAVESQAFPVISNTRTVQDPAVSIASLPALPGSHTGYELRDADADEQPPFEADLPAFSITAAYGNEGDGEVPGEYELPSGEIEFTITLSRALTEGEGDARVSYATSVESGQTATSGEDFAMTRGSKLFVSAIEGIREGTTKRTFSVRLVDDYVTEGVETFTVTLSDPTPNARLDENRKSAVGYIIEESAVPVLIIDDASGDEGSGTVDFTITMSRPSWYDTMVQYSTSVENGQTATPETDFTTVTGATATITAHTTTTTVSIPVANDNEEEPQETFTVTLSEPSTDTYSAPELGPGPLRSAVGTILDDDGVAPNFVSAAVDGTTLVLTYGEALDEDSTPDKRAYTVHADGGAGSAPAAVDISGSEVTLTLATAVRFGQVVTLSYEVPAENPVQDVAGYDAAGLTDEPVANNTVDTEAPVVDLATVDGTALVITFDEDLDEAATPANSAFTVKVGGTPVDLSSTTPPSISGATVTLTLASGVADDDTVTVSYVKPADTNNLLQDAAGNETESFTDEPVTNNTADTEAPEFASAVVYGTTLDIIFTETLDEAAAPDLANSAFKVNKTPFGGSEEPVTLTGTPSISGATVTLTLASTVADDDRVTVSYEKPVTGTNNRLQDAAGNETESFTDEPVTIDNTPAEGRPDICGSMEVGQILTPDPIGGMCEAGELLTPNNQRDEHGNPRPPEEHTPNGITDTDGKTNADSGIAGYAYRYRWIRLDANGRSNPTVVAVDQDTYTLVAADEGKRFRVQARFTDDKGNAEGPLTSFPTRHSPDMPGLVTGDVTAPEPLSAAVTGAALVITFDETLAAAPNLANSAFAVKKTPAGGSEQTVDLSGTPGTSGATVTLTLDAPVAASDTGITVSYTKPATGSGNKLQDAAGNEVEDFTDEPVTNSAGNNAASGQPTISGAPEAGLTLTAGIGDITDGDGLPGAFPDDYRLQWIRVDADGSSNPMHVGSDQASYTLVGDDVDKRIKLEVRFTDALGNAEGPLTGDLTDAIVRPSLTARFVPPEQTVIEGENATVTLEIDVSRQPDGIVNYRVFAHEGNAIPVDDYTPVRVVLEGVPVADFTRQNDGSYRYERTYELSTLKDALVEGEEYFYFNIEHLSVSGHGYYSTTVEGDEKGALIKIQELAPATGRPGIEGAPHLGETLTATKGTIDDGNGTTRADNGDAGYAYTYQWYRVDPDDNSARTEINGATSQTYTLTDDEQGKKVIVDVSFRDDLGTDEGPLASEAYPGGVGKIGVGNATGAPKITGEARVSQTLTATKGTIDDDNGTTEADNGTAGYAYTYQWYRVDPDGVSNAVEVGSDQDSYTLVAADAGKKIRVQVSFLDDGGVAEGPLESAAYPPTGTIRANNAAGQPTISGQPHVGETLTADTSGITDPDNTPGVAITYNYQWYRVDPDGVSNAAEVGSDQDSYELVAADAGKKIVVTVKFKDEQGNDEGPLESVAFPRLGTVRDANNPATGKPAISGAAQVGETLTALTGGVSDLDGKTKADNGDTGYAWTYQWFRVDADGTTNKTAITNATSDTYTLTGAEDGKKVIVEVSFTDDAGNAEGPLASDAWPAGTRTIATCDAVWCGTLTVRGLDGGHRGCANSQAAARRCSNASNLDEDEFTHAMADYAVTSIQVRSSGQLQLWISPQLTTQSLALHIGAAAFPFRDAHTEDTNDRRWNNSGLSWSVGEQVYLELREDTEAPAFSSAAVNGAALVITFDETLVETTNLANSAFTVKVGGSDVGLTGTPSVSGATVTLTLATAVAHSDTVTVSYTKPATGSNNKLQDVADNEVENFTDEAVDNITNAAATGKPAITGTAAVGETLAAGAGTIADDNGLPATFPDDYSFQWHRVDADGTTNKTAITGATSSTYTLAATEEDKKVIVAVSFTDGDGHAETLESDAHPSVGTVTVADSTAPAFSSATVGGTALVITFDEALAAANLANGAFTVKVNGSGVTLTGTPSISDDTVTLTLASAVAHDDTVTVSYAKPATDNSNRLEDAEGNETASFTDETVTNNTADTDAPAFVSAAVDGASLVIIFTEALAAAANLANDAFTVKTTPSGGNEQTLTLAVTPTISVATVTLTLASAVAHDDTVTVSYAKPGTDNNNRLEDADGNETASFSDEPVTNNTADTEAPAFASATVDGTALVLTFTEALAAAPNLANSAFTVKKTQAGGNEQTVTLTASPSISGATVALTLAGAVAHDDAVTVSYTKPATDNSNRLEDADGNETAGFTDEPVTNNTADTTAPKFASAEVNGTSLVITFDEALAAAPNLANNAFVVRKSPLSGGSFEDMDLSGTPSISGTTVTLTLASAVAHDDVVTVRYARPGADDNNRLEDAAGNEVESFIDVAVNNTPGVILSQTALSVNEGGTATYSVKLAVQPSGTVTVRIGGTTTVVTVNKSTLDFTTGNWATAQTVRVRAAQDADAINDEVTLTHTASGGGYDGVAIDSVEVTVRDDDRSVTVTPTTLPVDEGGTATYTVKLDGQPNGTVTVTIGGMSGTDVRVDDDTLDFTTTDWNTAQTVTVTAAQDADAVDDEVTLTHTASGGGFNGVAIDNVVVMVTDTTAPADPDRCDSSPGTMRLMGGNDREMHGGRYIEGRLEICAVHPDRGAVWGTICDDYWTNDEANVACRGLGFPNGSVPGGGQFLRSYFGPGTLDILLDDLLCMGNEGSLLECPTSRGSRAGDYVGRHNCRLTETVGVRCQTEAPILSVADVEAQEGTDTSLEFTVRLDRAASQVVTVDYATADGTAKAGDDYSTVSGTLRFAPGETEKMVQVRLLDDYIDEERERLKLVLSNASGADFPGGETMLTATGTIINSDPMPKGWLARFGRTSATQVTDMLGARFDAAVPPASQLTLGGRRIRLPGGQAGRERPEPAPTGTGGEDRETAENAETAENTENTRNTENTENTENTANLAMSGRLRGSAETERVDGADVRTADGRHPSPVRPADAAEDLSGSAAGGARHPNLIERAAWALLTRRESLWDVDRRRFLSQSSFNLSLSGQGSDGDEDGSAMQPPGGRWSLWGRGALTHFGGREGEVGIDGDVLTGLMGLDYTVDRWLAGVALSWSDGDGRYRSELGSGTVDSHLAGVYPYGRYALSDKLSVWGALGYGLGEMRLQRPGDREPAGEALAAGIHMGMGATGIQGIVYASEATELAVKSDVLLVRTSSEAVEGMAGVAAAAASRLRLLLSGRHQRALANDALLSPEFELGLRYDGGAAETGFGLELGGGLRYADPLLGLTLETRAKGLLTHEDGGYEEWGLSGSVQVDPGRAGRGLMLRLASGWGRTASGTQALWNSKGARGLAPQQGGAPGSRFSAEWSYGLDLPWQRGLLTPYAGVEMAGRSRRLRLGWRYEVGQWLSLSLDGERRETPHSRPQHGLTLRLTLPW